MSINARRSPRNGRIGLLPLVVTLALALVACGGGGGGGGGGGTGDKTLRVAVINHTDSPLQVQVGGDAPQEVAACRADVLTFTQSPDWILAVNDETVIDSFELDPANIDVNLVGEVEVNSDGTVQLNRLAPGTNVSVPSSFGLCG